MKMKAVNQRQVSHTNFLDILKRKFLVLLCFSIAAVVILHLLTNDAKRSSNKYHKKPLHKRQLELILQSAQEQSQELNVIPDTFTSQNELTTGENSDREDDEAGESYTTDVTSTHTDKMGDSIVIVNNHDSKSISQTLRVLHPQRDINIQDKNYDDFLENPHLFQAPNQHERNKVRNARAVKPSFFAQTGFHGKRRRSKQTISKGKELLLYSLFNNARDGNKDFSTKEHKMKSEKYGNKKMNDHRYDISITKLKQVVVYKANETISQSKRNQRVKKESVERSKATNITKAPSFKLEAENTIQRHENESLATDSSYDCPYEGLGDDEEVQDIQHAACIPYKRLKDDCNKAFDYFDRFGLNSEPVQCKDSVMEEPICVIKTPYRYSIADKVNIECDSDICDGDEVLLGCTDIEYGIIPKEKSWLRFDSVESLEEHLPNMIEENSRKGINFCLIKCASDKNEQPLIFPPLVKRLGTRSGTRINVNILVEDAVSRAHFYRSLPRTAELLRKLKRSKSSGVRILDFEVAQSYASFTVVNLRALFSGIKLLDKSVTADSRQTDIDQMVKRFQKQGYQALVQEDLCFFDLWGSVLSEKYNQNLKPFSERFKTNFQEYLNRTSYLDNRGLSQFACEIIRIYGYSNPFRHLPEICSNGKFVSEYLLQYVGSFLRGVEKDKNAAPAFIFTHLNTAHENKGIRIRADDVPLEKHLKLVSKLQNTITIIISDHGSKTTEYSINTFQGRLEVFSPLMFIIIPDNVAKILGTSRVHSLIANQKRLVSLADLHGMLSSMLEKTSAPAVMDYRINSLLAPIPLNRTCSDLEGLKSDVYCRCKGWNRFISTNSPDVHWLAQVAIGHINNIITQQFTRGRAKFSSASIGYGACARFNGKSVETARQEISGNFITTTLLLMVTPAYGVDSVERFEVKLNYSSVGEPNAQIMDIIRVSVYGKYEACADKNVDVKLCACADRKKSTSARPRLDLRKLLSSQHFGLKTSTRFLSSRCLIFGERTLKTRAINKLQTRVMAFEITNQCRKRTFRLKLGGTSRHSFASRKLPFTIVIKPRSIMFLYAVNNAWKYGRFKPLVMLTEE